MLLFLDIADPGRSIHRRSGAVAGTPAVSAASLVAALAPYLERVEFVVTSDWANGQGLPAIRTAVAPALRERIIGSLWEQAPPRPLSRYDHIRFWLTRHYVLRAPSWLALQVDAAGWPAERLSQLVHCVGGLAFASEQQALHSALGRYGWGDLWWGEGAPPNAGLRRQAHALMVAWSVPRAQWASLLGSDAAAFEQRLDLLLTIHAGAQHRARSNPWLNHWVHLPKAALGMRRPIEVMIAGGLAGMRQVCDYVWTAES